MTDQSAERRLAAILAADVAGYSRLMGSDEKTTLDLLRSARGEVIDPSIQRHRGRIFKTTGDGLLAEFSSVVAALECAVEVQQTLADRNAQIAPQKRLEFRLGIHQGDIVIESGDVFGDGVNIAARLEGQAVPGGICVSGRVYEDATGKLNLKFEDLGDLKLKNIARPIRGYRVYLEQAPAASYQPHVALPEKPSIAVLPFSNMSGDADQDYFADGMVEEITTGLARIRWLTVIARNSTFAYKGKFQDIRQIGRELVVRYVLEGSVRKSGNRLRITAQLIDADSGGHLWADKFDGTLDDVFDLQDQITAGVVAAIEPSVRKAEIERAKRKRPDNLDAYDLYLRALEQSYIYTPTAREAGLALLDAAIALDPEFVEAHGVAAFCLQQRYLWGGRARSDRDAALAHAEAVVNARTDDAATLAFAALALSALAGRHDVALVMVERALAQNPSSALAHNVSALVNMTLGRAEEGAFHARSSLRLSPFDPLRHIPESALAVAELAAGRNEAAVVHARRSLEANPMFSPGLTTLAICLVRLDRIEEAQATIARLLEIAPDTTVATLQERYLYSNSLGIEHIIADLRRAGLPD